MVWNIEGAADFILFSPEHLSVLALFAATVLALYFGRQWLRVRGRARTGRHVLAAVLILCDVSLNVWFLQQGVYDVKDTLPLELCSISLYMCVIMLLTGSRRVFGIVYFTGIGGALQAMLTPALGYGFPHFRFLEFFVVHMAIILSVLYMVWVEQYRPGPRSVLTAMLFLNVLIIPVMLINQAVGGNYMFLARKPATSSLLDLLGPYPWYLLAMEAVAAGIFLLLYLPFMLLPREPGLRRNTRSR